MPRWMIRKHKGMLRFVLKLNGRRAYNGRALKDLYWLISDKPELLISSFEPWCLCFAKAVIEDAIVEQRFEINLLLKIEKERSNDMERAYEKLISFSGAIVAESSELSGLDKPLALMANFAKESSGSSTTIVEKPSDISTPPVVAELHVADKICINTK
ncbi:hypothetical protein Tco_1361938 [Tanacetum coccineum]